MQIMGHGWPRRGPLVASALEVPGHIGTCTFVVRAEAPNTDCHAIAAYAAVHVPAPHGTLLLKVDPDNFPARKPDVAEGWSISPDATHTFKIRPDMVFYGGSRLTSHDVKADLDRMRNPPAGTVVYRGGAAREPVCRHADHGHHLGQLRARRVVQPPA
jgi:Bacterial extracellular solute-binding proteins, family 5 Middle